MKTTFLNDDKPIITCSTGAGSNQAIGIVRLSGKFEVNDLNPFFSLDTNQLKPRYAHLCEIKNSDGLTLDQVMLLYFPGPNSYTGENVLEIHCHGNQLIINNILNLLVSQANFRMASPGEFTYRALKNEKLTLSQVEGLDLLLNGQTQYGIGQGIETLFGGLHHKYLQLHDVYLKLRAGVELSIDFLEDVGEEQANELISDSLKRLNTLITELYKRTQLSHESLFSPQIVLVGPTNAGKSTLFNQILGHGRAIVSAERGTTRDYLSERVWITGNSFQLVDTAGLRETSNLVEGEGIRRSLELIRRAFFKILVINPFDYNPEDYRELANLDFDLAIFTHHDQPEFIKKLSQLKNMPNAQARFYMGLASNNESYFGPMGPTKAGPIEPMLQQNSGPMGPTKNGPIEPLVAQKYQSKIQEQPILLERHRVIIGKIHEELLYFQVLYAEEQDIAILSHEINRLGQLIEELIGVVYPDQVLNSIFSQFCIGK